MKFKIGDKVRITNKSNGHLFEIDEIVEIIGSYHGSYYAKSQSRPIQTWNITDYEIELFEKAEIVDSNKAKRFNTNKVEFDTLPWVGIIEMAKNSMYGAHKYDKYNFKKEGESSQYFNCKLRHLLKHHLGEDIDKESKIYHLSCEAWNALVELEHLLEDKLEDDRFKYSDEFIEKVFELTEDQKKLMNKENKDV